MDADDLPGLQDVLDALPPTEGERRVVMVEPVDEHRARLCITTPRLGALAHALYGRRGWLREPSAFAASRGAQSHVDDTYWCWVRRPNPADNRAPEPPSPWDDADR